MASIARGPVSVSALGGDAHRSRTGAQSVLAGVQTTIAPSPVTLPVPPWEGTSAHGRGVHLTRECNRYPGATPYYVVAYGVRSGPKGGAQAIRYTPSRARARELLTWFLRDVLDPAQLRTASPETTSPPGRVRVHGSHRLPRGRRLREARGRWGGGGCRRPR
jgi:hypothetical protein